ncbi:MAG: hypothetical protein IKL32_01195, partial [Alphaproteobacteria bacterium]|nr:hypothetical protein [Alphaproteobacteria bacterium]
SGNSSPAKGSTPDIIIPRAKLEEEAPIKGYGEADLPQAIAAEEGKKAIDAKAEALKKKEEQKALKKLLRDNSDDKDKKEDEDTKDKKDYQLDRALDIVHALSVMHEAVEIPPQSDKKDKK